ncbi:MAG: SCO family protein [Desulfobulbaceae bacterium]|nr:SCO family protein [Desulfobulbaceae bacterium]
MVLKQNPAQDKKWIEEKTGEYLPLDLEFLDEQGKTILLADFIDRPTILLPIYFYCPNICSKNLANLAVALSSLTAIPGKEFRVIALSFSDTEGPKAAAIAKKNYLKIVGPKFPESEWKFLTGTGENIVAVTDSVGFKFKKLDDQTFIHPAALMVIGGDGKIIRYVYGSFLAGDVDMALINAAKGIPSLSVKRLLSFCFNYDPDKNKSVFQTVKIGVIILFTIVVGFVLIFFRRKKTA